MSNDMADVYVDLIVHGTKNPFTNKPYCLDDVPLLIKDDVKRKLGGIGMTWQKD